VLHCAFKLRPVRECHSEANAIKEPDKKIEALEKFVTDFPNSTSVYMAHQAIFGILANNYPNQKDKILEQAGKVLDKAPERSKINLYNSLGSQLCDAGILLSRKRSTRSIRKIWWWRLSSRMKRLRPSYSPSS
jgi:Tol biopolymer transport system component